MQNANTDDVIRWQNSFAQMSALVYEINLQNGWFDANRPFEADVALLHSEVTEMFEAYRNNNLTGLKDSVQDEAADILIRLLDTCHRYGIDLIAQFVQKCSINADRGYRHGGKLV